MDLQLPEKKHPRLAPLALVLAADLIISGQAITLLVRGNLGIHWSPGPRPAYGRSMTTHQTTPTPPDDVDWAFVTDEPCEACGFVPGRHELSPAETLRTSGASWQSVISRDDVRERPSPDVWSPLEYAAHTRDVVGLFRERIELLLAQDDPQFGSWDGQQVAVDSDYAAQDPAVVTAEYAQSADLTADLLDGLDDQQLARTGSRADGRAFTVAALIDYLLHEVRHHLEDVGAEAPQEGVEEAAAEAADDAHDPAREAADDRADA